jgi:hypothetical protein
MQVDGLGATVYEFAAMIALPFLDGVGKIHAYKDGRCVRKALTPPCRRRSRAGAESGVLESLLLMILRASQGDKHDARGLGVKSRIHDTASSCVSWGERSERVMI